MTRIALFSLAFTLSAPAFAGGDRGDSSIPVYSDHSSDRPVVTEAVPERGVVEPFQVEYLGSEGSIRGVTEYDFAVGRDVYTASYGTIRGEGVFSLYGERGELIVGYVVDGDGLRIFDRSGVIESHEAGAVSLATMQDYGMAATLLSDPSFMMAMVKEQNDGSDDDGEIAALPVWVGVVAFWAVKCIDITIEFDSSGITGGSVAIDC